MKQKNFETGRMGEEIARDYLIKQGYEILESNFMTKFGEIDIIAKDQDILVFVEVKLKIGDQFGTPEDMITPIKIKKVLNMANVYVLTHAKEMKKDQAFRVDSVCIVLGDDKEITRINHHQNISSI